jgi:hypothetical protein
MSMNLKSKSTRREVMTAGVATVAMAVVGAPVVATMARKILANSQH